MSTRTRLALLAAGLLGLFVVFGLLGVAPRALAYAALGSWLWS